MEEAASIPLVGLTAWQALIEKTRLKKRQKVFIQADYKKDDFENVLSDYD